MSERVLVTGGGGFLGKEIVRQLLESGREVVILARGEYPAVAAMGATCQQGNMTNTQDLKKAMQGCSAVVHTAAKAGIWGAWAEYYQTNVLGTRTVMDTMQECGVGVLVYTSSPSVVFDGSNMQGANEAVAYPQRYEAYYPQTKAIAEQEVLQRAAAQQLKACSLRPHLIWGVGDNHLIPRFLKRAHRGQIRIVGSGNNQVDTVCVENAAHAHLLALEALSQTPEKVNQKAYFISNDEPISLFAWINRFVEAAGLPPVTRKVPAWLAWTVGSLLEGYHKAFRPHIEPRMTRFLADELSTDHWFDLTAARRDLGYQPRLGNEEGFQKVFDSQWFRQLASECKA